MSLMHHRTDRSSKRSSANHRAILSLSRGIFINEGLVKTTKRLRLSPSQQEEFGWVPPPGQNPREVEYQLPCRPPGKNGVTKVDFLGFRV